MASVRLVNRRTDSVVVVPEEKAAALKTLGFEPESGKPSAKKAPAKKATAKKSAAS